MKDISMIKNKLNESVMPGFILVLALVPLTIALNWHTADLDSHLVYTLALAHALSFSCMPYFILALLGFALAHTENGERIILPINLTAILMVFTWVATYFYFLPSNGWEITALLQAIDMLLLLSFIVTSVPFIYFFATRSKPEKSNTKADEVVVQYAEKK